jgi:hypothetical protein
MRRLKWLVWNEAEEELFRGCRKDAIRYYTNKGGSKAGLHFGYTT